MSGQVDELQVDGWMDERMFRGIETGKDRWAREKSSSLDRWINRP